MQNSFEVTPRSFNAVSAGLSNKAREAVNAAFDAMSTWRIEAAATSEKNSKKVIEKMAAAAAAMGWPEQVVNAASAQMQRMAEMQVKTMDQIMDAWEEQFKSPNPMTVSAAMLSKLKSPPTFGAAGNWSNTDALVAANPLQLWMQFAEQWQRSWANTMAPWTAGKST